MSEGIEYLKIKGFKGFANEIIINFFPKQAKNMVIYGKNGSGKTSIMEALKLLLIPPQIKKFYIC